MPLAVPVLLRRFGPGFRSSALGLVPMAAPVLGERARHGSERHRRRAGVPGGDPMTPAGLWSEFCCCAPTPGGFAAELPAPCPRHWPSWFLRSADRALTAARARSDEQGAGMGARLGSLPPLPGVVGTSRAREISSAA